MARALSLSLLFLLLTPVIEAQETLLRKVFRLTLLCLFIVSGSTTVRAQQRILWQGRVRPDQINVYTSASLSDRAAITLTRVISHGIGTQSKVLSKSKSEIPVKQLSMFFHRFMNNGT